MSVINVSPLNRDVRVGCLYDYNKDQILPEFFNITNEDVDLSSCDPPTISFQTFTMDTSEKFRLSCFGVDHYLSRQLNARQFEMNRLWFYNHLKDEAFCNCNSDNEFQIIVYVTYIRKTETLKESFINSNIWNYCDNRHSGTHLVEEVDYGAEFVLRLRKPIDPSKDSKQVLGQTMRIALRTKFFSGRSVVISYPPILNEMLETMNCSFQGSIGNGFMYSGTFDQCFRKIQEMTDMEKNDRQNIWRPVTMQLRRIPTKLEIQVAIDSSRETAYQLKEMQQLITQQCHCMTKSPSFNRLPTLKQSLIEVQTLLEQLTSACNNIIDELQGKHYSPKQYDSITEPYADLLGEASHWLTKYHEDVEKVAYVLKGNNLQVFDLRSINKPIKQHRDGKCTHVFVLHFACNTTDLDKRFKSWTKNPSKDLLVFDSETFDGPNRTWESIYRRWGDFLNEAIRSADNDDDYAVGILSPSSPYEEGMVLTIGHKEFQRAVNCTPSKRIPNTPRLASTGSAKRRRQE